MTWLSRLLTQNPSLQHSATDRTRQSQRRRRMMTLEGLEDRRLLSNVLVSYNPATLALTITGDTNNDGLRVTENAAAAGGGVTVAGIISAQGATTINGTAVPFASPGPVKAVAVNFTGDVNHFDKLILTGPGKTVATTVTTFTIAVAGAPNLGLSVNGVDNTGAFTLTTSGNINGPGTTATQINNPTFVSGPATIDNSTFPSLAITQTSPTCTAQVELGADTIAGTVVVSLGDGPNDSILLDTIAGVADVFGSTTLSEGNGNTDSVSVIGVAGARNRLRDLTITQGNGNTDSINVQILTLTNPFGAGLHTTQGNGTGDTTTINNVTAPLGIPVNNIPVGTTSLAGISVTQGNGNGDRATVSNSTVPGNISIAQGNGNTDIATVSGDVVVDNAVLPGSITVTQGNGNTDTATVTNSTAPGNISIAQGNGNGDTASLTGDRAGTTTLTPVGVIDIGGTATITQGNGAGDVANLDSAANGNDVFNNVVITQGNSVNTAAQGSPALGDTVNVNDSNISSNLTITQGTTGAVGNYVVNIGVTSAVTAGGFTTITQTGADNTVNLGPAGFTTMFLDIFTGAGGGGFVTAQNTTVLIGSLGAFVIDGGDGGNTFLDLGGNTGVNANPADYNTITLF